mmetsp:Transcript_5950/g.11529  ORF Transcript_5950/g.11529 Transcript_5950/m.11529 type:complete len:247 (-) Transcript_5950:159-899(-)
MNCHPDVPQHTRVPAVLTEILPSPSQSSYHCYVLLLLYPAQVRHNALRSKPPSALMRPCVACQRLATPILLCPILGDRLCHGPNAVVSWPMSMYLHIISSYNCIGGHLPQYQPHSVLPSKCDESGDFHGRVLYHSDLFSPYNQKYESHNLYGGVNLLRIPKRYSTQWRKLRNLHHHQAYSSNLSHTHICSYLGRIRRQCIVDRDRCSVPFPRKEKIVRGRGWRRCYFRPFYWRVLVWNLTSVELPR